MIEYYVVPKELTKGEQEQVLKILCVIPPDMRVIRFLQAARAVGRPIQTCADVQLAAKIQTPSTVSPTHIIAVNRSLFPVGETVEVVRRADMEAQVTALNMKITQLKSCLANIRATCLQAGEGPTPANSMVAAGMRAMHMADVALNGEGLA
ncbi:hypothetical protein ACU81Q_15920 [Komagataeibacter melomenusus]